MSAVQKERPWWAGLSFVRPFTKAEKATGKAGLNYWDVQSVGSYRNLGNYGADVQRGREVADELVQLLVQAPTNGNVTLLGCMLADMTAEARPEQRGVMVGFGSVLAKFALLGAATFGTDAIRKFEGRDRQHPDIAEAPPVADPLLDLVQRYEAEERRFNATPHATSEEAAADIKHLNELLAELRDRTPRATSAAGALAALRLAHDFMAHSTDGFERSLIGAAIAFLHGEAVR